MDTRRLAPSRAHALYASRLMTMSTRRFGALATALGVCALAGCGSSSSTTSSTAATQPTTSTASSAQSTPTSTAPATPTTSATSPPSKLPPPTRADGRVLEVAVAESLRACRKYDIAQVAPKASERLLATQQARALIAPQVDAVIALFKHANPDATIPYGEERHVTMHEDALAIISELEKLPPAAPSAAACAPEIAARLSQASGVSIAEATGAP